MMKKWKPTENEIAYTKNWGIWTKEESEFPWTYDSTETCYILEGQAEVTDSDGNQIKFSAGDMVEFPRGVECTWKITKAIRKRYNFS